MSIVTLATVALACFVAATTAAPTHDSLSVDLAGAMERSVCPIKVRIDEDENRIPRRIKMLECAKTPNPVCHQQKMTHACCNARHHSYSMQCLNVTDHVLVRYRNLGDDEALHKYPVLVGCSCMISHISDGVSKQ